MKLTKIRLENLGPYVGVNEFNFHVSDRNRKVVLIGGKNGAGKTTLFNAIRVGLYGCRAYGYESDNARYLNNIADLVNASAKLSGNSKASVTISILMDDGKDDFVYTFERNWSLTTKSLREKVTIRRGNELLNDTEMSDFQSYLLQLIPPDMFRFYFFDGESIGNFVFNGVRNTDFKNAFLKLCGLDTMEIIYENFQKLSNAHKKDSAGAYEEYLEAKNMKTAHEEKLAAARNRKDELTSDLVAVEEELALCESQFSERGGITKAEYQALHKELSVEESSRETQRNWLKETANTELPFVFLRPQLQKLREQILSEEKAQASEALMDCLNNAEVRGKLCDVFTENSVSSPFFMADQVITILQSFVETTECDSILNLSKIEQLDLLAQINEHLNFNISRIENATSIIDNSLNRVTQIREIIKKSDESGSESFLEKKEALLNRRAEILNLQLENVREIDALEAETATVEAAFKKGSQKYEEYLKARSVNDVTAKALLAFRDLQKRLYRKYVRDVEASFAVCFKRLINKSDLIDGITIDEDLQVYPYRNRTFARSEIMKMIKEQGPNYVIDQLGNAAFKAFNDSSALEETLILPVEVRQKLSAGEQQIFIMSLYQALSGLNKVSVPYIIDTPFARIDTEHRKNILTNFFMELRGQTIILSTDEEVVGAARDSIEDRISDCYLLHHKEDESATEVLAGTYFEEAQRI